MENDNVVEIKLTVSDDKMDELHRMVAKGGFASHQEFFDVAITLLRWAMTATREGRVVAAIDEDAMQYRELQMGFIEFIRTNTAKQLN